MKEAFAQWANFYVIVGSSAGALTGLQFVVMTLLAQTRAAGSVLEVRAFGTPTVVHFCVALFVSALLNAPWPAVSAAGTVVGVSGAAGVVYVLRIIRHARRQTGYSPDAEDWFWYAGLPLAAYAALMTAGILLMRHTTLALFVIAATTLVLLFAGIHNAWDTVTYVVVKRGHQRDQSRE